MATLGLLALMGTAFAAAAAPDDPGRFGPLHITSPAKPVGFTFIISDAGGWSAREQALATSLAAKGWVSAGIDLALYRDGLKTGDNDCHPLAADFVAQSKTILRQQGVNRYLSPAIIGFGQGATLASGVLAQSVRGSFSHVISVGGAAVLETPLPLCALKATKTAGGFSYADLPQPASSPGFEALTMAQGSTARLTAAITRKDSAISRKDLAQLPIVPLPVTTKGDVMVVFIAGDGGWRDLDRTIGERLQTMGIPVVGLDTLRYFWSAQSPERLASDLGKIISYYSVAWNRPKVILAGYSFGADVMPAAYNRLPTNARDKVTALSLLALSKTANFEVYVSGWIGIHEDDGTPILPEIQKIPANLIQCIYGEDETSESLCPLLEKTGATVFHTKGGHHFDHDYETLARRVAKAPLGR